MKTLDDPLFDDPNPRPGKARDVSVSMSLSQAQRLARGCPQAVVRVLSYGTSVASVRRQVAYISRNNALAVEDQDGERLDGEEVRVRLKDWSMDYNLRRNVSRESMHRMLSAPPGADEKRSEAAARAFLKATFSDTHEYLFVRHDDTGHAHVHGVVKMTGHDGQRRNPGRLDLRRWRSRYAGCLRDRGVEADASSRLARGVGQTSPKNGLFWMERQGKTPDVNANQLDVDRAIAESDVDFSGLPWGVPARKKTEAYRKAMGAVGLALLEKGTALESERGIINGRDILQAADRIPVPVTAREARVNAFRASIAILEYGGQRMAERAPSPASIEREARRQRTRRVTDTGPERDQDPGVEPDFDF